MKIHYSHTTSGFYPADMRGDYEAAGTWPTDAIELTEDEHSALRAGLSAGKHIDIDNVGRPVLVDPPLPPLESVRANAISTINSVYNRAMISLTGDAPQAERETWAMQLAAAEAHQAGIAMPEQTSLLDAVRRTDETMDTLTTKIVGKASLVRLLIGVSLGIKRRAEKAVEIAQDREAVQATLDAAKAEMDAATAALSPQA